MNTYLLNLLNFAHVEGKEQDIIPEKFHLLLQPFGSLFIIGLVLVIFTRYAQVNKFTPAKKYRLGSLTLLPLFVFFAYNSARPAALACLLVSLFWSVRWIQLMGRSVRGR
jgi:hypothetical protein